VIPEFDAAGNLPPGIHEATLAEVCRRLFAGLEWAINELQAAGAIGSTSTAALLPRSSHRTIGNG
jgi:hypothetical protein